METIKALPRKQISVDRFPDLIEITEISIKPDSLYLSLGLSSLQTMIRCKSFPDLLNFITTSFEHLIANNKQLAQQMNWEKQYNLFESTFEILLKNADQIISMSWLDKYVSGEFPEIVDSIVKAFKVFSCSFLLQRNLETKNVFTEELGSDENGAIIEGFALCFRTYFNIIWDNGSYVFDIPGKGHGFMTNLIFYPERKYSILHSRDQTNIDLGQVINPYVSHGFYSDPYEEAKEATQVLSEELKENTQETHEKLSENFHEPPKNPPQYEKIFENPIEGNEICDSLIANLLSIMALKIKENNLYSKDIQDCLKNAEAKFPNFRYIPGIEELSKILEPFCKDHKVNKYIKVHCGNSHCQCCIFDIISSGVSKDDFKRYCSCNIQISPKEMAEIRKTKDYEDYISQRRG